MIKKLLLITFLFLFTSCNSCSDRRKTHGSTTPTIAVSELAAEEKMNIPDEPEYSEPDLSKLSFAELIRRVPITPLPFGIEGLDSLYVYEPAGKHIQFFDYDTLNVYGLNDYFLINYELDEGDGYMPWVKNGSPTYFSRRLPPLGKDKKEVMLFYQKDTLSRETGYYWQLYICEPNGKIVYINYYMSAIWEDAYVLGYIDKDYILKQYTYSLPHTPQEFGGRYKNLTDEVCDSIKNNQLTILHARNVSVYDIHTKRFDNPSQGFGWGNYYWKDEKLTPSIEEIDGEVIEYPLPTDEENAN